jgi:hypothetical protein
MKIKTESQLLNLLKKLHEQDEMQMAQPAAAPAPAAPAPATPGSTAPAPAAPSPTSQAQPITLDDIIEKLNIIRAGRSTKDDDVKSELENYVLQFSEEDKSSLLAFLDGLGRILTPPDQFALAQGQPAGTPVKSAPAPGAAPPSAPAAPKPAAAPRPAASKSPVPINVGGI